MGQTTEIGLGKMNEQETGEIRLRRASPPREKPGMKPGKRVLLVVAAAVALIGLTVGGIVWSKRGVVKVQTGKALRQDLSSLVTASGEIKPPEENYANVSSNSYGKITEILVKEGDRVKKGQLLLRTEDIQQTADVDAQEAALRNAQADMSAGDAAVQSSAANLRTAQADLNQAQAKLQQARDDYTRGQQLFKDSLIAQQDFDHHRSDFEVAQAAAQSAQARVVQASAQYQQALFNRDMAKARVAQNRAQLIRFTDVRSKTIYTSPLDGLITSLPVHVGENVVPGIQNQSGNMLFQVSDLSVITAEVKVDETDIVNVKLGQPADVTIDAIPNKTFKGHVTEIGQSAVTRNTGLTAGSSSTTSEEAKDFKVVVTLDSPPPGLRPGLSTTAKVTTATRQNAVTVPIQALTIRQRRDLEAPEKGSKGQALAATAQPLSEKELAKAKEEIQGLFVIQNGRAVFIPVETGIMGVTDLEILKGVQPGDTIVTGPYKVLRTLKNNAKVQVDNTPIAPASSPSGA